MCRYRYLGRRTSSILVTIIGSARVVKTLMGVVGYNVLWGDGVVFRGDGIPLKSSSLLIIGASLVVI